MVKYLVVQKLLQKVDLGIHYVLSQDFMNLRPLYDSSIDYKRVEKVLLTHLILSGDGSIAKNNKIDWPMLNIYWYCSEYTINHTKVTNWYL